MEIVSLYRAEMSVFDISAQFSYGRRRMEGTGTKREVNKAVVN